ncbi:asparagine synthase-related protein [Embleya scabrispora]|uniref:asparagine synthase-related protein n=1 Tax=Embleya scabrispora TaxID=159449 RepID=UPI00036784D0|nr:asparagine synthase-related protein [Embleya scabrispora]MYS84908.1 asparagine synthase [Streptomyces sp. SID5474]
MDFLILPDASVSAPIAVPNAGPPPWRCVAHASGRPWLVGHWSDEDVTTVVAGTRRLVLFGHTRLDVAAATRILAHARSLHDLDELARTLPGSVHLLASIDGRVRAQGALAGTRQIFHARVAGVTVAADRPRRLADLVGAHLDEEALALRLLAPGAPWPLCTRSVWTGVDQLDAGCWLEIDTEGAPRTVPWWQAPAAEVPLPQAADSVRAAIRDAVAVRTAGGRTVSADLSGGLDSTGLCFVAAAEEGRLLTHHWKPLDPANDDTLWAERAAALLPTALHCSSGPADGPGRLDAGTYDGDNEHIGACAGAGRPDDPRGSQGPLPWSRNLARMEYVARDSAARGATVHLMGVGGDELFSVTPTHLRTLARRRPLTGLPVLLRCRALNRWDLLPTLGGLTDNASFADALRAGARRITAAAPPPSQVFMGWAPDPRLPAWVSPSAVASVRRLLFDAAAHDPRPLHPDRAGHRILEGVLHGGAAIREMGWNLSRYGIDLAAPYLDDRVVEAALSVRLEDRMVRGGFKPVLTTALRGLVPDELLARRSKGDFSAEFHAGVEHNRHRLAELCDDLRLARLGLVDADALRAALLGPSPDTAPPAPFENTLACEGWLRSVEASESQLARR